MMISTTTIAAATPIQNMTFTREDASCAAARLPLATLGLTRVAYMTAKMPNGQNKMTVQTAMAQCGLTATMPWVAGGGVRGRAGGAGRGGGGGTGDSHHLT